MNKILHYLMPRKISIGWILCFLSMYLATIYPNHTVLIMFLSVLSCGIIDDLYRDYEYE